MKSNYIEYNSSASHFVYFLFLFLMSAITIIAIFTNSTTSLFPWLEELNKFFYKPAAASFSTTKCFCSTNTTIDNIEITRIRETRSIRIGNTITIINPISRYLKCKNNIKNNK